LGQVLTHASHTSPLTGFLQQMPAENINTVRQS
jgi:hypothetical protein